MCNLTNEAVIYYGSLQEAGNKTVKPCQLMNYTFDEKTIIPYEYILKSNSFTRFPVTSGF